MIAREIHQNTISFLIALFVAISFCLIGSMCNPGHDYTATDTTKYCIITFKLNIDHALFKLPRTKNKIKSCVASVRDNDGNELFKMKSIELIEHADFYLTEELEVPEGEYKVILFALRDETDRIISLNNGTMHFTSSCGENTDKTADR
jgi:hypothetical protein